MTSDSEEVFKEADKREKLLKLLKNEDIKTLIMELQLLEDDFEFMKAFGPFAKLLYEGDEKVLEDPEFMSKVHRLHEKFSELYGISTERLNVFLKSLFKDMYAPENIARRIRDEQEAEDARAKQRLEDFRETQARLERESKENDQLIELEVWNKHEAEKRKKQEIERLIELANQKGES